MEPDVLILGGGVAGVAAALAACGAGSRVMLVRARPGASALSGGGWHGSVPPAFASALAAAGYPLLPCDSPLAHSTGFLDNPAAAPPWHVAAHPFEGAVVCGIAGLPAFRPGFLARAWAPAAGPLGAATLELPETPAAGWSPVSAAAAGARAADRLGESIAALARERDASGVILPPVLGLDDTEDVWRTVSDAAGVPVGEALGGWPSVPGWRLDRALLRVLAAAGVEVLADQVVGAATRDGRIDAVRCAGGRELRPGAIVLATGKYVGGGLAADPTLREPALGLPVWVERLGQEFAHAAPLLTTEMTRTADQPLLRVGVRTDDRGRVLPSPGKSSPANLVVAGSVRADWETATSGLGHAAADGWSAGLTATSLA